MKDFFTFYNRTDNWETPKEIFSYFKDQCYKDFNPLNDFYTNSLLKPYDKYFCNPPFSNIEPFVDYMIKCSEEFNCVLLLPIRLNTNWFIKLVKRGVSILVIGRIRYSGKGYAPFDSMLVLLDANKKYNLIGFDRGFKNKDFTDMIQLSIFDI